MLIYTADKSKSLRPDWPRAQNFGVVVTILAYKLALSLVTLALASRPKFWPHLWHSGHTFGLNLGLWQTEASKTLAKTKKFLIKHWG